MLMNKKAVLQRLALLFEGIAIVPPIDLKIIGQNIQHRFRQDVYTGPSAPAP